ncbi:uncharacterized protein EI90DRAFT_3066942 [Cantharellus anzutake]|uniref:uncharacterized protein n=1 Tax=Cantharellus anzutake TaxID=1750568 RepID=UPI0019062126|nr:uncharacterized protein EI90DRAFT_3066942 [Cantharellus anzutake]KAF8327760.1 hypothetical protein EI90DRAFT_3066942 [Cantharellus anzutake]
MVIGVLRPILTSTNKITLGLGFMVWSFGLHEAPPPPPQWAIKEKRLCLPKGSPSLACYSLLKFLKF